VIEVSVLHATLRDGILHQQTQLINPETEIPLKISEITGISQQMVDSAPLATEVWRDYLTPLSTGVLTAHNLAFDYGFLQAEFAQQGVKFVRSAADQLCTVILSRLMLPELPSRSLPYLVKHFAFPVGRSHRAAADTSACWLLTQRLLTEIQIQTDEVLLEKFAQQWLPLADVAGLFGCSSRQAREWLAAAGLQPRLCGRQKAPMYQRGAVECIWHQRSESTQLSWL
jgi:DNA polymerase-3 subunit epsilon